MRNKKKWTIMFLLIFSLINSYAFSFAKAGQESIGVISKEDVSEKFIFTPKIISNNSVEVGKNIIFRVDISDLPKKADVREYLWEFGDGDFSSQEEVVHIFPKPGRYNVKIKIVWRSSSQSNYHSSEFLKEIFVYERSLFFLSDLEHSLERIESIKNTAEEQNVYLNYIRSSISLRSKGRFLKLINRHLENIRESDTVIIWSDRVDLLTILNSFAERVDFQGKDLVVITDGNIGFVSKILSGIYPVLTPKRIIITRREAIDELFTTDEEEDVVDVMRSRGYDIAVIDKSSQKEFNIFDLPSYGISYLQRRGVEDLVVLMILFLPVIVTLVTFLKVVIGFSSLGVHMPIIFTYAFVVLGWTPGIAVIISLALISYLFRVLIYQRHLLYIAKVGVLASFLGLFLLFVMGVSVGFLGFSFDFSSALIMVVVAVIIDRVAGSKGDKGIWSVLRVFIETLIIASFAFLLVSWDALQILMMSHPEVLLLFIVANVFMGRFTGLRLLEYFRFREVLRFTEEE